MSIRSTFLLTLFPLLPQGEAEFIVEEEEVESEEEEGEAGNPFAAGGGGFEDNFDPCELTSAHLDSCLAQIRHICVPTLLDSVSLFSFHPPRPVFYTPGPVFPRAVITLFPTPLPRTSSSPTPLPPPWRLTLQHVRVSQPPCRTTTLAEWWRWKGSKMGYVCVRFSILTSSM